MTWQSRLVALFPALMVVGLGLPAEATSRQWAAVNTTVGVMSVPEQKGARATESPERRCRPTTAACSGASGGEPLKIGASARSRGDSSSWTSAQALRASAASRA